MKNNLTDEKRLLKKALSIYFSVNIFVTALIGLTSGMEYAKTGTRKTWFGEEERFIYVEDMKKIVEEIKEYLFFHNINDKINNRFG